VSDRKFAELAIPPEAPGRAVCPRCRRPSTVCYCPALPSLATRTRVVVLQHPRERRVGIGTGRMAHLSLPGSVLRVGVDFTDDAVLAAALAGPAPAYVLYPRPGAVSPAELPRDTPITLVVLDGTCSQARKLLHRNPVLARLPGIAFAPSAPSNYRIRRQPAPFCVSTIEALAETLAALEPGGERFERLREPFEVMVSRQEHFVRAVRASRHRHEPGPRRPPALATRLAAAWPRVVCVQGEANAWPWDHPDRPTPEIIHWLAHRPATGESYERVVAPRRGLASGTALHARLAQSALLGGATADQWRRSWQEFLRPDDLLLLWGRYHGDLAAAEQLALPGWLDLRTEVSRTLRRKVGTVEACAAALSASIGLLPLSGRGGRRLSGLVAVARALASWPLNAPLPARVSGA
jgi:DTW domain-containing protein YfiP